MKGVFLYLNILSVGYEGRYIGIDLSVVGVGFNFGWEKEKFRLKIDPPGSVGFEIMIDFGRILKDLFRRER